MIAYWLLRLLRPAVGRFPAVCYWLAGPLGWLTFPLARGARRNLEANLLPVCGGDAQRARREALRAWQNVGRYWIDLCSMPYRSMAWFARDHVRIVNPERLAVLEERGPVLAVSAHTGNAELVVQALDFRGREFAALVEALQPPRFGREVLRLRTAGGGRFYPVGFAGVRACLEVLQDGGLVGLMGDRDIRGRGVCVELFGRPVRLPEGPWEIARRTGARVVPVFTVRERADHFALFVEPWFTVARTGKAADDIREAAQRWAKLLEAHLQRDPGQWTVLEDYWGVHRCGEG